MPNTERSRRITLRILVSLGICFVAPVIFSAITQSESMTGADDATTERVTARHILIAFKGSLAVQAGKRALTEAQAKAKAEDIRKQLIAGGSFEEMAKKESDDTGSAIRGGSLGSFGRGQMIPEFEQAVFEAKVGEIPPVIRTMFGYHIIKVDSHDFPLQKRIAAVEVKDSIRGEAPPNSSRDSPRKANDEAKPSKATPKRSSSTTFQLFKDITVIVTVADSAEWSKKLKTEGFHINHTPFVINLEFSKLAQLGFDQRDDPARCDVSLSIGDQYFAPATYSTIDATSGADLFARLMLAKDGARMYMEAHKPGKPMRIVFDIPEDLWNKPKQLHFNMWNTEPIAVTLK